MSVEDKIVDDLTQVPRETWTSLPDLPRLSGPTIFQFGRWFLLRSPASVIKMGVDDGEDAMTALAHAILGGCVPRVLGGITYSPVPAPGKPPRRTEALVLTLQPGTPLVELWPTLSAPQRTAVKSGLCDLLIRMREQRFDYYGRPRRQPYILYYHTRPVAYSCCSSRGEWDDSRLDALRASTVPPERIPKLEQVQREINGVDGWDRPVLTHVDLTNGNILVDPDTLAITGFIDWERANILPAYFEYVAARLTGAHLPEWRKELLGVLREVLRRECGATRGGDGDLGRPPSGEEGDGQGEAEEKYRKTLEAWDAIVDVERFAQGYEDDCYWTFDTGLPDCPQKTEGSPT